MTGFSQPAPPRPYLVKGFVGTDDHLGFVGSDPNVLGVFGDARMLHRPGGKKRREQREMSSGGVDYTEPLPIFRRWALRERGLHPGEGGCYFRDRSLRF